MRHGAGVDDRDGLYPSSASRRGFLRGVICGGAAGVLMATGTPTGAQSKLAFRPAAFDARSDSVLVWLKAAGDLSVRVEYATRPDLTERSVSGEVRLGAETDFSAVMRLDGLRPGTQYWYRAVDTASAGPLAELGRFATAPASGADFSFVFSGDMEETYRPFRLFDVMAGERPDFFLHLGDTAYCDHPRREFVPSLAHYRRKHAANRQDAHLQSFLASHTTYAIWDDHEIENGAHGAHPAMAEALLAFKEYWPCQSVTADSLYRSFRWSSLADFFVLDTRRFRSPQTRAEGADKTMLGAHQKAWFKEHLKRSDATFKFVATSVPFHGGGADTWGNYRTERAELREFILAENIPNVVFLTADYHLARDWSNPKTGIREYMAGPIATFTHYSRKPETKERYEKSGRFHYGDGFNFGAVRVFSERGRTQAEIRFVGATGETLWRSTFVA